MYLKTERLTVSSFRECDRADLMELLTDEEIKKTYMIPDFESEEAAERMVDRFVQLSLSHDRYVAGVFLDEKLIGFLNDTEISGKMIEMGYVISPKYKNRGFCTEALAAMISFLFEKDFSEVVCGAFDGNIASIRVMQKCGMTRIDKTDVIEYRGAKHNCVYYSIKK